MARPTIKDLAQAAGLSIATVNRVLAGAENVRQPTREIVAQAAERIGFYGLGAIQSRIAAHRPKLRFGVLLLQPHRAFYQSVARALRAAAQDVTEAEIDLRIEFLEDLSPQNTADRALAMAQDCQAISVTTAVHPVVTEALESIEARGIPVFTLISQLAATGRFAYVGLDNWKVGRTAAWAFHQMCQGPGKIGILVGNPRYRNQEMNEAGFRSYFRECAADFTLLEPRPTFESSAVAQEMTEVLLAEHPDLRGLFVSGGGISGAVAALRTSRRQVVTVAYDLMDVTRAALLDGTITLVIAHRYEALARGLLQGMTGAALKTPGNWTAILPFDLYTRENV
jgi:LacI family transcriptional regulator